MKTLSTITEKATADRTAWIQERRTISANLSKLGDIYDQTRDETPAITVAAFVSSVGHSAALEIIASLVNRSSWDGRISADVRAWAASLPEAWDEEAADRLGLFSSIHMAHINQLARALMEYTPAA